MEAIWSAETSKSTYPTTQHNSPEDLNIRFCIYYQFVLSCITTIQVCWYYWTLKMETIWSFETSKSTHPTTQHNSPEDLNIRFCIYYQFVLPNITTIQVCWYYWTLKMETIWSSETSKSTYPTIQYNSPEDLNIRFCIYYQFVLPNITQMFLVGTNFTPSCADYMTRWTVVQYSVLCMTSALH